MPAIENCGFSWWGRTWIRRWSIPGDYATVEADGTIRLLGRGTVCINSGGEKIFPEEVEEVLKRHPAVRDAVCVGVPDKRFGEAGICKQHVGQSGERLHVPGRYIQHMAKNAFCTCRSAGCPQSDGDAGGEAEPGKLMSQG